MEASPAASSTRELPVQLSQEELILYLQCLNEVLRGFSVENIERTLGVSESELAKEDASLRKMELSVQKGGSIPDVRIRPEVIGATMKELGESEFQTRTGYELSAAKKLLKRLEQTS